MKVVIIEDEFLVANELESIIQATDNIQVIRKLESIRESIDFFNSSPEVDLIFSDIQLSDGLSFEIFKRVEVNAPIIFCTAFDNYALDAFRSNGVDYILKPFDQEIIKKSLNKVKGLTNNSSSVNSKQIEQLILSISKPQQNENNNLLIYKGDKIIPLAIKEIAAIEYVNSLVYVHSFSKEKYLSDESLDKIESLLGEDFYRVNRQSIIHKKNVDHVSKYFARKLLIQAKIQTEIELVVSKAKASDFLNWLKK